MKKGIMLAYSVIGSTYIMVAVAGASPLQCILHAQQPLPATYELSDFNGQVTGHLATMCR